MLHYGNFIQSVSDFLIVVRFAFLFLKIFTREGGSARASAETPLPRKFVIGMERSKKERKKGTVQTVPFFKPYGSFFSPASTA